jgi:hypothetical protein
MESSKPFILPTDKQMVNIGINNYYDDKIKTKYKNLKFAEIDAMRLRGFLTKRGFNSDPSIRGAPYNSE